jgi:hypothetical protein
VWILLLLPLNINNTSMNKFFFMELCLNYREIKTTDWGTLVLTYIHT